MCAIAVVGVTALLLLLPALLLLLPSPLLTLLASGAALGRCYDTHIQTPPRERERERGERHGRTKRQTDG
jgi:hypothetical protein